MDLKSELENLEYEEETLIKEEKLQLISVPPQFKYSFRDLL